MDREFLNNFRKRPWMFVNPVNYSTAAAFLKGIDHATEGGFLAGFKEWLAMKVGGFDNHLWTGLIPYVVFPDDDDPWHKAQQTENQERMLACLFDCLEQYLEDRNQFGGLQLILVRHHNWYRGHYGDSGSYPDDLPGK